jgi:hypothetical protein
VALLLFTDFGAADLYVGQVKAVLDARAPGARAIDLLHDAPAFDVKAAAHLLAALVSRMPAGQVVLGVVDPGVGTDRGAVAVHADANWYVGPDNGLFSVLAARAATRKIWTITNVPPDASPSFHGRDVFAPLAAAIATGRFPDESVREASGLAIEFGAGDLPEVIYIDHYGNAWTGLRAAGVPPTRRLQVAGREVPHARVFGAVPAGAAFWYENSSGLVEVAVNRGSAAHELALAVGTPVAST